MNNIPVRAASFVEIQHHAMPTTAGAVEDKPVGIALGAGDDYTATRKPIRYFVGGINTSDNPPSPSR